MVCELCAKHLQSTCKALAKHWQMVFFTDKPLSKGFLPLNKGFACIANNLQSDRRVTYKQTDLEIAYISLLANKPTYKVFTFITCERASSISLPKTSKNILPWTQYCSVRCRQLRIYTLPTHQKEL